MVAHRISLAIAVTLVAGCSVESTRRCPGSDSGADCEAQGGAGEGPSASSVGAGGGVGSLAGTGGGGVAGEATPALTGGSGSAGSDGSGGAGTGDTGGLPSDSGTAGIAGAAGMGGAAGMSAEAGSGAPGVAGETQWIVPSALTNARDLGGVPLAGGTTSAYGLLYRGPSLAVTGMACGELATLGLRTIIDLRMEAERQMTPDAACAVNGVSVVAAPLPTPTTVTPEEYLAFLDATEAMAATFAVLAEPSAYPVYVHCTWGRDRTGVVAALVLLALGAPRAEVEREYLLSQPSVGVYPDSFTAALDAIAARGGAEAYLTSIGISAAQLAALRAQLTAQP